MENNSLHPGIKLCHKLTNQHIWLTSFAKMRVCLAAHAGTVLISVYCALILVAIFQVLSSSVADALTLLDEDETMETRKLIRLMDKFFDCLNVRNTFHGTTTRNENLHP